MILIEPPKRLSINNSLRCFSCKTNPASHVCRYRWEEVIIQACLCFECMEFETIPLFEKVMGYCDAGNDSGLDFRGTNTEHLEPLDSDNDLPGWIEDKRHSRHENTS